MGCANTSTHSLTYNFCFLHCKTCQSWGKGDGGQLGLGPKELSSTVPARIHMPQLNDDERHLADGTSDATATVNQTPTLVTRVWCGMFISVCCTNKNELYVWGQNLEGCLGLGESLVNLLCVLLRYCFLVFNVAFGFPPLYFFLEFAAVSCLTLSSPSPTCKSITFKIFINLTITLATFHLLFLLPLCFTLTIQTTLFYFQATATQFSTQPVSASTLLVASLMSPVAATCLWWSVVHRWNMTAQSPQPQTESAPQLQIK